MIPSELGKAVFAIAAFVTLAALGLLPFLARNSAEFVVTVLAAIAGGLTILLLAVLVRLERH